MPTIFLVFRWTRIPVLVLCRLPLWRWPIWTPGYVSETGCRKPKVYGCIFTCSAVQAGRHCRCHCLYMFISGASCNKVGQQMCLKCKVRVSSFYCVSPSLPFSVSPLRLSVSLFLCLPTSMLISLLSLLPSLFLLHITPSPLSLPPPLWSPILCCFNEQTSIKFSPSKVTGS